MKISRIILLISLSLNIFFVTFALGKIMPFGLMPPITFGKGIPPIFFGPPTIFTEAEMKENFVLFEQKFDNVRKLRDTFVMQLRGSSISEAEVKANFTKVDAVMESMRNEIQKKVAQKISRMTPQEREELAGRLEKLP